MPRKKAEFKHLGTLPKGEWTMVQSKSGAIFLACADHQPKILHDGKLTEMTGQVLDNIVEKGKTDVPVEES